MSVETLQHLTPPNLKQLDILIQPDVGGRREQVSPFNNTIVIARPIERILPPTGVSNTQKLDTEEYLARVARLQNQFDGSLETKARGPVRNYNPVLERAMFETLQTEEERKQFKLHEIKQIETALRERYHVATSIVIYDIDDDGKLRSRDLPNQAFEDVLTVGIEYYRQMGSHDVPRIEQEKVGIVKIQKAFADPNAPVDLKVEVISGPGLVEGTIFTDNFLDRYELLEDPFTRRRIVQMTRFASDLSYEQAEEMITASRPDYFNGRVGSKDQWLLANPIFESSGEILIQRKNALKEEGFQKIAQGSSDLIHCLVDRICGSVFAPEQVKVALNAVLNGADYIWEGLVGIKDKVVSMTSKIVNKIMPIFKTLEEKVNWLGYQAVRVVAGGCGLSAGFSVGGIASKIGNLISGIVRSISSVFGGEAGKKGKSCISCGEVNYCTEKCYVCNGTLI
ncbi:hypothetical protein HYS96_00840 [Candidatus Daviesbacteria bacterium]|nr:hypothetical protein [Candidatus Daviesbacteria bacterium]